jgi:hypothetical protein
MSTATVHPLPSRSLQVARRTTPKPSSVCPVLVSTAFCSAALASRFCRVLLITPMPMASRMGTWAPQEAQNEQLLEGVQRVLCRPREAQSQALGHAVPAAVGCGSHARMLLSCCRASTPETPYRHRAGLRGRPSGAGASTHKRVSARQQRAACAPLPCGHVDTSPWGSRAVHQRLRSP